ncbi:MAG: nucleotide exchange factor GrpE [Actinobacteria bacterium]|nr:nucleotide exchange factor GrpE [Actinomycetota bacterium]NDH97345.1 nucleotide exchange factor GrpE [Actinomycetota bacterium]
MSDETNDAAAADVEDGAAEAPADTTAADAPVTVEDLVVALEAVTAERDQHLADLQRVSAEFQNFRKQTEKRNSDFAAQAGSRVAEALLPVLDACDAAAQQGVEGVEPIAGQLRGELERAGLQVIAEVDAPFDPNLHEAAMSEPGDDGQDGPIVAQVLRTGYAWNGRVLRAAMVKVKG